MEFDSILVANTKQWIQLAKEDLACAVHALSARPPFLKDALFHFQPVEKFLKGFLTWHDIRFRRAHDLDEIGKQCAGVDSSLSELTMRACSLSAYASHFRYPGADYQPTLEETELAAALTREVLDAIIGRLPKEACP